MKEHKDIHVDSCAFTSSDGDPRIFIVAKEANYSIHLTKDQIPMLAKMMVAYVADRIWRIGE